MIIELMLEFNAWSTSRPTRESDFTADFLEKEVNDIMEIEKEQGRSLNSSVYGHVIGRPMFYYHLPWLVPVMYLALTFFCWKRKHVNASMIS